MKKMRLYLCLGSICLLCIQGTGFAETMYVTDHLYLSLRNVPDPNEPHVALLPSDTKVDVLETDDVWAKVMLEDGRTGWVMKRFLVENVPKSQVIEQLKGEIEDKNIILGKLRRENASSKEDMQALKKKISQQERSIEITVKEDTVKRLKELYGTGIAALLVGLIIGYLVRRPKKRKY